MADVKTVVTAAKDVDEEGICWRRCGHDRLFDALRLLRASDPARGQFAWASRTRPGRMRNLLAQMRTWNARSTHEYVRSGHSTRCFPVRSIHPQRKLTDVQALGLP
jgi:hypothetical protein